MTECILKTEDLSYKYAGDDLAINDVSINIEKGKKVAFLGGNGAGKTTLFLHLNGILKPQKGKVFFNNQEVKYNQKSLTSLRKSVGIVFQDPDTQLFSASVKQEISFGPMNLGFDEEKVERFVNYALEATDIFSLKENPTHFLSYGEKRKVTIASILAMMPEVLIVDEPTNFIDPKNKIQIMNFLTNLNLKSGTTIIISTHDVDIAFAWADIIFVMKDGQIIKEGTPLEIFEDMELIQNANLSIPLVLEIYNELKCQNYIDSCLPVPTNRHELLQLIRINAEKHENLLK